jgi:hypothetical protein
MTGFRFGWLVLGLTLGGFSHLPAQSPDYPQILTAREQREALEAAGVGVLQLGSITTNPFPRPGAQSLKHPSQGLGLASTHRAFSAPKRPGEGLPRQSLPGAGPGDWKLPDLGSARSDQEKGLFRLLADEAFPGIFEDVQGLSRDSLGAPQALTVVGKTSTAVVVTGAAVAESSLTLIGSMTPSVVQGSTFLAISQWAGPVGYGALSAYEGFTLLQWDAGYMTDRQFARHQANFLGGVAMGVAGGFAGAKAGAVTGGLMGAFFGPAGIPVGLTVGAAVGLVGGGLAGGITGSAVSRQGMNRLIEFHDHKQEEEYLRFLRSQYSPP